MDDSVTLTFYKISQISWDIPIRPIELCQAQQASDVEVPFQIIKRDVLMTYTYLCVHVYQRANEAFMVS